ncbi:hypothetical protein FJZ36_14545 [Candidatus Poribacteria bacterium]|nr:hypothetical protein [Candidatus Poribacteria bacterium]
MSGTRHAVAWLGLAATLTVWTGCAAIVGETGGALSANLASVDMKAESNMPEFNDGSRFTFATTRSEITERDDPNWMDAEKYTAATIKFAEPTKINKIMIYTKDLDRKLSTGMLVVVDYLNEKGEWVVIREWDRNPIPKNPVLTTRGVAKKVRLRIKRPLALFSGGGGGGNNQGGADTGERSVYEMEIFQYVPKQAAAESAQ